MSIKIELNYETLAKAREVLRDIPEDKILDAMRTFLLSELDEMMMRGDRPPFGNPFLRRLGPSIKFREWSNGEISYTRWRVIYGSDYTPTGYYYGGPPA